MSHRKFEAPRHGSTGFSHRKRASRHLARTKSYPKDDPTQKVHLTTYVGYKAGMTHVMQEIDRTGSKLHKKTVMVPVTVIEAPAMVVIGVVGYTQTLKGLQAVGAVWSQHVSDEARRRFYKNWYRAKKLAFTGYSSRYTEENAQSVINNMKSKCTVVRAIVHSKITDTALSQRKAHIIESQINGGSISEKFDWAFENFEKEMLPMNVFSKDEMIDVISVTKGKGFQGVTKRFGTKKLQHKNNHGVRKVGCIGAWHPAGVQTTVPRAGQMGYHHRVEASKKIYRIGEGKDPRGATTEYDITEKPITPMGGFPGYGEILSYFIMIKGSCGGPRKRVLVLRKAIHGNNSKAARENVTIKMIDTSSKIGHGRFQTSEEKRNFMGPLKQRVDIEVENN